MAKTRYNVTLDPEVHDKAVVIASKDDRSFSYLVNGLLKTFIGKFKKKRGR